MQKVRKAVSPVGGLGTRFRPATKAMPKEILPILELPILDKPHATTRGNTVTVMETREETRRYGLLDVVEDRGKLVRAKGVVEKPDASVVAPSTLMNRRRYIIKPEIFARISARRKPEPATRSS